jgi:hypothetical protein
MSIQDILNQLELRYGRPSGHELLQNDALFCLPFCATEAPERLFWRIEQCKEIQVIVDNPYTPTQLMTNTIQLLMMSGIFPIREFEGWKATPKKLYNSLKLFVHVAHAHPLVAIQLCTTGQQGYVANQQNHSMYNLLEDGASNTNNNVSVATSTQQMAANVTTGSTLGGTYAASLAPTNPSPLPQAYAAVATAINQLSANQTALWAHMQNMSLRNVAPPTHVANQAIVYNPTCTAGAYVLPGVQAPTQAPPIHAVTIPSPFHGGGFSQG